MKCPPTMSARLVPHLRYYSSHRPGDNHGASPSRPRWAITPSTSRERQVATFTAAASVPRERY